MNIEKALNKNREGVYLPLLVSLWLGQKVVLGTLPWINSWFERSELKI